MGVADSLLVKIAENGIAFVMAALIIAGLAILLKYVYQHMCKEVEFWRAKAEACINGKLEDMEAIEEENERLKQRVSTLENVINKR